MIVSTFELLPVDIIFEVFDYLPPVDILQSFLSLNKRFSRIIMNEYLWHIHIGNSTMSLSMFNDLCQNALKVVGSRLVSLRVTLTNAIGGWSLVSSSLKYHQTTLLQRLHLIDIEPHEFDNLLRSPVIKQLHTLLVDVTQHNPFNRLEVEGVYLTKVCSQLSLLTNCRLSFNVYHKNRFLLDKYSEIPKIILPNLLNTTHLRTLSLGINTTRFLKRLISCIPFIENLSIGVEDVKMTENDTFDMNSLPAAVDASLLLYLSRLHIYCENSISFRRIIALLSSVFGQLSHLSLKIVAFLIIPTPLVVSGDIIQQLCIDRLKPLATYNLNIELDVKDDLKHKIIYNSFLDAPFTNRQRPRYSLHHVQTEYFQHFFSRALQQSCQMPINGALLFPRASALLLTGHREETCVSELGNFRSSISSLVPWSLLRKTSIDEGDVVTAAELESILRMAYNVHTLEVLEDSGFFAHAILHNIDNLGTLVNQQVQTLILNDRTLTFKNTEEFCILVSNQLPNLKNISFNINDSYDGWSWRPSRIVDGENKSTKLVLNVIYSLVDHLQQLVSLHMNLVNFGRYDTPCFPHVIRQQLRQNPLNRLYRLRCSAESIQVWL
ncbi:unnamed protein product [Rotaria magnacalcarata]|uniref:F-box domain-containing protein n=2 Tax=Rotaria magnacalcarata TaxID=392030 RepID=A0A816UUH3_9BILA|nr:unnamed protein product [Rotaria magnacalcarata]